MYSLKHGPEAMQILEQALPTLAELAIAPTTYFMPSTKFVAKQKSTLLETARESANEEKERGRKKSTSKSSMKEATIGGLDRTIGEKDVAAELEQAAKMERFKVPAQIASDFYAWCSTCEPPVIESVVMKQRTADLANKSDVDLLSPREVRELLSALQMGRRQQQATTKHTKNGYKLKINKNYL